MKEEKVDASVETAAGDKITIKGSKDAVKDVISIFIGKVKKKKKEKEGKGKKKKARKGPKYKEILRQLVDSGFFKGKEKTVNEVIQKLQQKGYTIKGRRIGAVATALGMLCKDPECSLERRHIKKEERKGREKWAYSI